MPFLADLETAFRAPKPKADPWSVALAGLQGDVTGNVERVSVQHILDLVQVPMRHRKAPWIYRRLTAVMLPLGWSPIRMRDFNRGGYKENVRGYARNVKT